VTTETTSSPRRSTTQDAPRRDALLDAAQQLLLEHGYAAVTARRVATQAGLKPQLVHYYFSSMDELFVQLVRRGAAYGLDQLNRALESPQPLRALWRVSSDPYVVALSTEYMAVAHHRKAIAHEVARAAERFRIAQHDAFREALDRYDVDPGMPLGALLLLLEGLARVLVLETSIGTTTFHAESIELVEHELTRLEGAPIDSPA
jgi:AcrR family transcriptional regulator